MNPALLRALLSLSLVLALTACEDDPVDPNQEPNQVPNQDPNQVPNQNQDELPERPDAPTHESIYSVVSGCFHVDAAQPGDDEWGYLAPTADGESYAFDTTEADDAARFYLKASDLGTYLFFDHDSQYFLVEEEDFLRRDSFLSDIFTLDDTYLPGVQWELQIAPDDEARFHLRHLRSGRYLTTTGLTTDASQAATIALHPTDGCAEFPELTLDAEGEVVPRTFDDGSVYGFVETHSHIFSNFGFGGAGIFHGAPYHPFGVEHALPSCEMFHGSGGRYDLFGYGFDNADDVDETALLTAFINGQLPEFYHHTDGYPTFTDWPNAHKFSTHQTQYYLWIKRAYLGGLRLMINHATTNQIICDILDGADIQPTRYSCNDMVAVDRILEETRRMERYIDAQAGGPGLGFFRIVESPEEAREVINDGKMAVVLGIETSNLFDCNLVPPDGESRCTEADVLESLDYYYDQGVRVIFPVHKFDNAFSAGDGQRDIMELANFAQTGHWSNFVDEDCPDLPSVFDRGGITFADLNEPRDDYLADPPNDMSNFADDPVTTLLGYTSILLGGSAHGDFCQNAGLTELGEFLMEELMRRGMVVEIDHLPRRGYQRAFELLEEFQYPAAGTHGNHNRGELYELGGISKFNFGRCSDPNNPGGRAQSLRDRITLLEAAGQYPAEGFGFDLNGFAGAPGPRFGDDSVCETPQENPISYPFQSLDGDITFTQPRLAERTVDFNTEGLVHVGLIPELIEDVRNDGVTDEDLEPLFRSAEGYLRMWEASEARGAAIRAQ